jgi:hypothetical protein
MTAFLIGQPFESPIRWQRKMFEWPWECFARGCILSTTSFPAGLGQIRTTFLLTQLYNRFASSLPESLNNAWWIDERSMYEASKVSRSFRDALIPRQRKVTMAGFRSFESFRQMNFLGMESWNSYSRDFITDRELLVIASDVTSYPRLSCADILLCKNVTCHRKGKFIRLMDHAYGR